MNAMTAKTFRVFCEALSNPLTWFFLTAYLIAIYLIFRKGHKGSRHAGILLFLLMFGLYAIATPWLPNWMVSKLESKYPKVTEVRKNVEWVVVLGGGTLDDSTLSTSDRLTGPSLKRALEGLRLYQVVPNSKLILSGGGTVSKDHSSAKRYDALTDWLKVPEEHRILAMESVNTHDEAKAIKAIVGDKRFYLVTSALHMPRAMALFHHEGMRPIPAPCDYITYVKEEPCKQAFLQYFPHAGNILKFNVAWHEYLGMMWASMRNQG